MKNKFKIHNMYSETGVKKIVRSMKQHLFLKKLGYTHTKK